MSGPDWSETARGMLETGMTLAETSRELGRSPDAIKYALDINGERQKRLARRAKERELYRNNRRRRTASELAYEERKSVLRTYGDRPEPAAPKRPTLPALSILARPLDDVAEPARIRFAPKSTAEGLSPGAARIREIHLDMIRRGRIAEPGVLEEMGMS